MMDWLPFLLALAAFYGAHLFGSVPGLRRAGQRLLGRRGHAALTGAAQLATLVWAIGAAGQAPHVGLWDTAGWMRWLANLVMPGALALTVLALGAPNPLSFGGPARGFDPARPGLAGVVRHPILWALALWAGVHLLVNGDLAHALLFGGFAVFALWGMRVLDRRRQRALGEDWARLAARTSNLPFAGQPGGWRPAPGRLALAAGLWLAVLALHPVVIGVSPLP